MTSEDVIHSFFVPAFRTKQDVVPGRYSTTWFKPTKPGKYHLFCAEYCGTNHSGMIGWIYVMEPQDYQAWLSGGASTGTLAETAQKLFQDLACANCHKPDGSGRCPILVGLFGKTVQLTGGGTVKADEAYIRESILQPAGQDRGRLSADHAHLSGPGHRRERAAVDRIHQVAGARSRRRNASAASTQPGNR